MKILFINPPSENTLPEYSSEKEDGYIETEDFGFFPPLGLLYVLSYLEKNSSGHDIYFKDCVAERISHEQLKKVVYEIRPDIIGITSFTISMVDVCLAARNIRMILPKTHICLGGHHPIAFPYQAIQLKEFDSVIVGEGEIAFTDLVNAIEAKKDITEIKGVYTSKSLNKLKNKEYKDTRFLSNVMVEPAYIDDLDILPFPNRKYIKHINYNSIVGLTDKLATIISSRGCPYKCIYCDVPYKRYRKRSIQNVVDEVEECLDLGYKEFHFYDDLFNITPEKIIEFCDEIIKRKLKFHWDFRGRVNTATRESLLKAKKSGCRMISFGVETGTDEGLKYLKKGTTVQKNIEVFKWCREIGIKTIADFMIGLPFEKTKEDVLRSIDFLIKLDPDYAQISILGLFPNTELYNTALEKGLIPEGKWEEFSLKPTTDIIIDHWEEYLTTKELVELQKIGYKKYYLRPSYIIRSIFNTRSFYEFKTKVKGVLTLIS